MYLIDSDVFIQAKNMHYGFDICPAFWEWLEQAHANEVVFSIAKVHEELRGTQDEVTQWANAQPSGFFLQPDEAVVEGLTETSAWLIQTQYTQAAQNEFLQKADYYLVGLVATLNSKPARFPAAGGRRLTTFPVERFLKAH